MTGETYFYSEHPEFGTLVGDQQFHMDFAEPPFGDKHDAFTVARWRVVRESPFFYWVESDASRERVGSTWTNWETPARIPARRRGLTYKLHKGYLEQGSASSQGLWFYAADPSSQ